MKRNAAAEHRSVIRLWFGRLAGDRVLFRKPRAEIDEAAALAAERPERRRLGPFNVTLAGGAGDLQLQQLNVKGTSALACVGRLPRPFQARKRTLER